MKAQMAAGGFEIQPYGVVLHLDGTANHYVCGDVSPEKGRDRSTDEGRG